MNCTAPFFYSQQGHFYFGGRYHIVGTSERVWWSVHR